MPDTPDQTQTTSAASSPPAPAADLTPEPARITSESPLIAQYELGDVAYDVTADAPVEARPAAVPKGEERSAPVPPAPSTHSKRTLRMAEDLGLSKDLIERTAPDVLDDLVYDLNRQQLALSREHQTQQALQNRGDPKIPVPGKPPPATGVEPSPEDISIDLGIDEEPFDPDLIGAIKRAVALPMKEIAALKASLAEVTGREQLRQQESMAERLDRHFATHAEILGTARGREMKDDSAEYAKRIAILGIVDRDGSSRTLEQKIDAAVAQLFGTQPAPAVAQQTPPRNPETGQFTRENRVTQETPAQQRWQEAALRRPTQRQGGAEPPGEKKALATAARIMKEQGLIGDDGETPENGFLP